MSGQSRARHRCPVQKAVTHRLLPLSDSDYVNKLNNMAATPRTLVEHKNKRTGQQEPAKLRRVTDRTVHTSLKDAVADGVKLSVSMTQHIFSHSYTMHMLYSGVPLKVLQSLMGNKSLKSTEVYACIFELDFATRHRAKFLMLVREAVAMLKKSLAGIKKQYGSAQPEQLSCAKWPQ